MRHCVAFIALSCIFFSGCGDSNRKVAGDYQLVRFDEGGVRYYLTISGDLSNGGGVFDGTVQEIGWNHDYILARVKRLTHSDPDGWYFVDLRTKHMTGPVDMSYIKTNMSFFGIRCRTPNDVFFEKHRN